MSQSEKIVREILAGRGITDSEEIAEFLSDKPKRSFDPLLLPDMAEAADCVYDAVKSGKHICVYGDYDADGVTAAVLLCSFLKSLPESDTSATPEINCYIPSRFEEGYGLNEEALKRIAERGADLVITVDCGSVSAAEVCYAHKIGLDIVITDHHEPEMDHLPDCPVVNPKRSDSAYPEAVLSGCGVAFKLAQAIRQKYDPNDAVIAGALNRTLDLVAIATVADIMPLRGENRTLVKYGLNALNNGRRIALRKLAEGIGLKLGTISAYNIAFGIAPHINAAGRMTNASAVTTLLLTADEAEMDTCVNELLQLNIERRAVQERVFEVCVQLTEDRYKNNKFLLLRPSLIHEGVSGIVAGKVKNKYGLPVAVLSASAEQDEPNDPDRVLKGSARSIDGVNMIEMLKNHEELFLKLGGHAMAAGFSIPAKHETVLRERLNAEMRERLIAEPNLLDEADLSDVSLNPDAVDLELAKLLEQFEPTGSGNPRPLIKFEKVKAEGFVPMGEGGRHLRFHVQNVPCVFFGYAEAVSERYARGKLQKNHIEEGDVLTFIGTLHVNRWNGKESLQFIVSSVSDESAGR